jgi:hypothetical protein
MIKRGFRFEFEIPDDWAESREGTRFIFRGPTGEELIVSGALIEGSGNDDQMSSAMSRLVDNAMKSVARAAAHPELVVIKDLRRDEGAVASGFDCWTLHSQTKSGEVQFSQAVISNRYAVLLVTYEAPNDPDQLRFYRGFLKGIRSAPTH